MEIQRVFALLKNLTAQTSTRDLIATFQDILRSHFLAVNFKVYELQSVRIENQKKPFIGCLDCEESCNSFLLHENDFLTKAYQAKESLFYSDRKGHHALYPVILYDRNTSHIISIHHQYELGDERDILLGLLDLFTDIFRNIHEKGYDPLTRILNRQAFDQAATEIAYSKNKEPDKQDEFKSIAILDIDRFKQINDTYGHAIGDETLVLFAQTVRSVLRQEDLFFRYGGEEFVILLKDATPEHAQQAFDRCRAAIEERRFPQVGKVTVSIGFTDLDKQLHPNENLSKADKALYYCKKNGRNKTHHYENLVADGLMDAISFKDSDIDFWD